MSDTPPPPPGATPAPDARPPAPATSITEILQTAYIDYSMSVIISRALPDARDGLKPVQRRILYAMLREGLLHNRPFDKCAGVVGEVLKNYHPHGDASVYDTLVRLAQPWVLRLPLIEPQGNFGSVDGDPPAAYRYTECRLSEVAEELLAQIDEETVDFTANYKESTTEPTVLPAGLPNLLMNGSTGIAVGMATNIPPHNLGELVEAITAVIERPDTTLDELCRLVQGPDFPTGGQIAGRAGIDAYLRTGRGIVRVRGRWTTETIRGDREAVVITEIPYAVNRKTLVEHMAELIRDKRIEGISDLRDESDEQTRIVVELKRGELPERVVNQLYEHTAFQNSFGVILLALDRRRPKQMNLRELIDCFVDHRREIIRRRTEHRLRAAEARAHLLEGFRLALDVLDDVVRIIRAASNREEAHRGLRARLPLSEVQADAILDLRLYQLTGLERDKIEAEYRELQERIADLRDILAHDHRILGLVRDELRALGQKYATPRRTEIVAAAGDFRPEDLIANEGCVITVSHEGFIKRTAASEYRTQKRGGRGVLGAETYEKDFVERLFTAQTHDHILFITSRGRAVGRRVFEIPEGPRTAKGKAVSSVIGLESGEGIAAMVCIPTFTDQLHLVLATRAGVVKKTSLAEYANAMREGGLIGIVLEEGDAVVGCVLTTGRDELIFVSRFGQAVRFREEELRDQGRATVGVIGMRFKYEGDYVTALEVVDHSARFLVATEEGKGIRSRFEEYRLTSKGTTGVIAIKLPENSDLRVAGALRVRDDDEIMLLTKSGQSVRCPASEIREVAPRSKGVKLVDLAEGDRLLTVVRIVDVDRAAAAAAAGVSETGPEGSGEEPENRGPEEAGPAREGPGGEPGPAEPEPPQT